MAIRRNGRQNTMHRFVLMRVGRIQGMFYCIYFLIAGVSEPVFAQNSYYPESGNVCSFKLRGYILKKKLIERSRVCHNHKPQSTLNTKRKRKRTKTYMRKTNKQMYEKHKNTSSLFPKRDNQNPKRKGETRTQSTRRLHHMPF